MRYGIPSSDIIPLERSLKTYIDALRAEWNKGFTSVYDNLHYEAYDHREKDILNILENTGTYGVDDSLKNANFLGREYGKKVKRGSA